MKQNASSYGSAITDVRGTSRDNSPNRYDQETKALQKQLLDQLLKVAQSQLKQSDAQRKISELLKHTENKVYSIYTDTPENYMRKLLQQSVGLAFTAVDLATAEKAISNIQSSVARDIEDGNITIYKKQLQSQYTSQIFDQSGDQHSSRQELSNKKQVLQNRLAQLNEDLSTYQQRAEESDKKQASMYALMPEKEQFYGPFSGNLAVPKDYWSVNSEKTREAQQFLKALKEEKSERQAEMQRRRIMSEHVHKQREEERAIAEKRAREEERKRELEEVQQNIHKIQHRKEERKKQLEDQQQQVSQYLKQKPLYVQREEQYMQQFILPALEERKRRLSEIRSMRRPRELDQEIAEHQRKLEEYRRQHETSRSTKPMHEMSPSSERAAPLTYRSKAYERSQQEMKTIHELKQLELEAKKQKCDKLKEYANVVKEKYQPKVDENKTLELRAMIEKQEASKHPLKVRSRRHRLRIDKPDEQSETIQGDGQKNHQDLSANFSSEIELRKIGREYLEYSKQVAQAHKKTQSQAQSGQNLHNQSMTNDVQGASKQKYKNYLHELRLHATGRSQERPFFDWRRDIDDPTLRGQEKFERIIMKVQQMDDHARRQEVMMKYNIPNGASESVQTRQVRSQSHRNENSVEDIYINSIKAKLAILHEFMPEQHSQR